MQSGEFIYEPWRYVCRKLSANTWESKYIGQQPWWLVGNLSFKKNYIIFVKFLIPMQSNKYTRLLCGSQGHYPSKQLLLPLSLLEILHCQQYIFVVTNGYILFSSSETHSGAKQCHQSHCGCCDVLLFTLSTRQCLCVPVQRVGPQLLEALGSMAPPHQWVSINAPILSISRLLSMTTRSKWVICSPGSCSNLLGKTNPTVLKLPYKQCNHTNWKKNWVLTSASWKEWAQQRLCLFPAICPHIDEFSWLFGLGWKKRCSSLRPACPEYSWPSWLGMTRRENHAFDPSSLPDLCELRLLSGWGLPYFMTRQREAGWSDSWL